MTQSRVLNMISSALILLVLLGAGSAQTCQVSMQSVASGAAQCLGSIYAGVAANSDVQAMVAASVAEYGLPSAASGPITYVTAAALVQPRIAEVLGFVQGGVGCIFTNATINQTADAVWAKVKMFFEAHCTYVAPVISACMRNVSQPRTCGSSTSYVTNATNSLLDMYCNTTTWQFKESLSAGLANEVRQVIGSMCDGSKVSAAVSAPIFADLRNAGDLVGGIASGANFTAADVVGLLISSAVNGSLSALDLRSLPALARNFSLACKSGLPYVLSQTFDMPSDGPLLAAVGSLCDGLTARFQNVSTPVQLVVAASMMVKDAMGAISEATTAAQVAQALGQAAFGARAAGNLTAAANMSYQVIAALSAALANVTGSNISSSGGGSFDPVQAIVGYAVVGAAFDPNGYTCGLVARLGRVVRAAHAALAPLSAKSGNLVAAELQRLINGSAVVQALLGASALPSCSPAVAAGILRQFTGSVLVPAGCNITGYDSIVACLLLSSDNNATAASNDSALASAVGGLRSAFVYALLTGVQNTTRASADLARLTGLSAFLNNTLPHLNNITAVAAQANQLVMAVVGQFASALTAPLAKIANASSSFGPSDYVDAALMPLCNVTRQATGAIGAALAQQAAAGNYLARDVQALAQTPAVLAVCAAVQNVTQQVCECSQTTLAVHRAVMAYINKQRLSANDSMKIINFTCDAKTPDALYAAVRGALVTLSNANNPCATSVLAEMSSPYFLEALGYVLNATRMACDSYKLSVALSTVFLQVTKSYNIYTDPYGFLTFFLNQAAWDKYEAASWRTVDSLALSGNLAAIQQQQLSRTDEFRVAYGYFDNVTTIVRSFVSLFSTTCLRADARNDLMEAMFYGSYALTNDALAGLRCGFVDVGRCAMRALNAASHGAVDSVQVQIAFGSAYAAGMTGLSFLDMRDLLDYNQPTNDYSPKAKTMVVAFFGGGWMQSAASPTPEKCYNVATNSVLITNRNYTLTRSYDPKSKKEWMTLSFYALDKSGAQVSVARYNVTSGPKGAPAVAPVKLTNAAGKLAAVSQGQGFNVVLTANANSKVVKVTDSLSRAGFAFYVVPTTRNIAVVVRGTQAAMQTSIGSLGCGCLNVNPAATLLGTPRPVCFTLCSTQKKPSAKPTPNGCTANECRAVASYKQAGLNVIDDMERTT